MTRSEILNALATGKISPEDADKLLGAETSAPANRLICKVSEKGALSVYGLQRMPVTLYVEQWQRLLGFADEVRTFMEANAARFSHKGDKKATA
jgi:hypothetical protein